MALSDIMVPIAPGELVDKITILEIKSERIEDEAKIANVRIELDILSKTSADGIPQSDELTRLTAALKEVNQRIWDLEDDIRDCERQKDFGEKFEKTARLIYRTNDERAALKKEINLHLGSTIVEEKSYADYG